MEMLLMLITIAMIPKYLCSNKMHQSMVSTSAALMAVLMPMKENKISLTDQRKCTLV